MVIWVDAISAARRGVSSTPVNSASENRPFVLAVGVIDPTAGPEKPDTQTAVAAEFGEPPR